MAGAFVDLDPTTNQLIFSFADTPSIWVDVASLPNPYSRGQSARYSPSSGADRPRLHVRSGSIPLPEFDVGDLVGLPNSTVWRLNNNDPY